MNVSNMNLLPKANCTEGVVRRVAPEPLPWQGTNLIVALFICPECLLVKTGSLHTFILFPFFMTHKVAHFCAVLHLDVFHLIIHPRNHSKVLGGDRFHWCPSPAPLWVCDAWSPVPPCACSFHCFAVTNDAVMNTSCLCILCWQRHIFGMSS